jgi:hypothetical protein
MSDTTEVIILAQGVPGSLGQRYEPRQLLPLPACNQTPIMCRTVVQIWKLTDWWPTVVTWSWIKCDASFYEGTTKNTVTPAYVELAGPGNSALKGIGRYLERRALQNTRHDRTIVLLGDVVYSWDCLRALHKMSENSYGFAGTKNLSLDKGDLWGVAWSRNFEDCMLPLLRDALLRHPPFDDDHEAGQFRRWISGMQRGALQDHVAKLRWSEHYVDVDDYTHDIDIPHDLVLLPELSKIAAADDAEHGVIWSRP